MKAEIQNIMRLYQTRYDKLNELMYEGFKNMDGDSIDVYIDAASILRTLINRTNNNIYGSTEVCSELINTAIHYKHFMQSRFGLHTTCFLVVSYKGQYEACKDTCVGYNSNYIRRAQYNSRMLENIEQNLELLKTIIDYIPGIYVLGLNGEEFESSAVINYYCKKFDMPSLIVSRDALVAQAVAYNDKAVMLYPSKSFNGAYGVEDTSKIISQNENRMNEFYNVLKGHDLRVKEYNDISLELIPLIMAMNGYDKRSIKSTFNISMTYKMIKSSITSGILLKWHTFNENATYTFLSRTGIVSSETALKIQSIYLAFDTARLTIIYDTNPASRYNPILDLHDDANLEMVNNKYFKNNPIDLLRL